MTAKSFSTTIAEDTRAPSDSPRVLENRPAWPSRSQILPAPTPSLPGGNVSTDATHPSWWSSLRRVVNRFAASHPPPQPAKPSAGFGPLGVLLVSIATVCTAWTTLLIVLTLKPNETANFLMGTTDLDDGQFWLIVDPDPEIKYTGVVGLSIVAAAYVYVLARMLARQKKAGTNDGFSSSALVVPESTATSVQPRQQHHSWWTTVVDIYGRVSDFWRELTSFTGTNRKIWVRPYTSLTVITGSPYMQCNYSH